MAIVPMRSRFFAVVFFIASLFQILLCGGVIYGWATVVNVFKKERFFYYLCDDKISNNIGNSSLGLRNGSSLSNSSSSDSFSECAMQRERLNLIFMVAVFSVAGLNVPVGIFLDKFGPKATMMIAWWV